MNTYQTIAVALYLVYFVLFQWTFRCQRVGRALVALSNKRTPVVTLAALAPSRFVFLMWLSRIVLIAALWISVLAWGWVGPTVALLVIFTGFVGATIDQYSPWPSYWRLLSLFRRRITAGGASTLGVLVLPYINSIESRMKDGMHFETVSMVMLRRDHQGEQVERDQAAEIDEVSSAKDSPR